MKRAARAAALVLALSMALGLAACGDKEKENESGDGRVHFSIVTTRSSDAWPTEFLHEGIMKELEDKYNIYIDWEVYTQSDWAENKALLMSSGEMPDAFLGSDTLSDLDIQNSKGLLVELTDLIAENMPNLSRIMEEDQEIKTVMVDRDGEIYGLPKKLPMRPQVANQMFINKKWLDNLGLEMPTTYKELEEVLKAFKELDADGDGDPDNEYPYSYGGSLFVDSISILAPFGTITSFANNYMGMDENGNPAFLPIRENYKEAVIWMHSLYEQGLIDQEHFTQGAMYKSKLEAEGGSQVGMMFGWSESAAGANADEFVVLPALAGPDGNRYVQADPTFFDISGRELVVSSSCENVDLLLQWADEFYTDLVTLQTYYATIGEFVIDNGDGTYTVNCNSSDAWSNSLRDYGPKYMSEEFEKNVILDPASEDGQKMAEDYINAPYATGTFPTLKYTADQLNNIATLASDIYSYVEGQYAHWVVDGGIEEEWDAYLDQLEQMGVNELIAIHEDAYQYYLEQQ